MRKRILVIRCTHEQDEKHSFPVVHNLFSTRPREKEGIQSENTVGRSLERPKQRRSMKCEARQQKLAEAYDELLVMNSQLEAAMMVNLRLEAMMMMNSRLEAAKSSVLVRASCKERGHHGLVTVPSRDLQRREAVLLRHVLVRASCKERRHHGLETMPSRE